MPAIKNNPKLWLWLLTTALLLTTSTHLLAHAQPTTLGLSADLSLAASWRSDNQQSNQAIADEEVWQIPGVLMGGHASNYEKHTSLDELSLAMHYLTNNNSYASLKIGSHGGTEISLENALFGQAFNISNQPARVEAGLMTAFFSPSNHEHPSTTLFSLPSLGYTALLGGHVQDTGIRAAFGQEARGFSLGIEANKGSSYPASNSGGLYTAYLRHAYQGFYLDWQLQGWYLNATAKNRKDDRSAGGHSHSVSTNATGFTGSFDGETQAAGLFSELQWNLGHRKALKLRSEYLQVNAEGLVEDESGNRQLNLDGEYQSLSLEPSLLWGLHTFGLRYERLSLKNTLTGAAASQLGAEANLINDGHEPQRFSAAWKWQYTPNLALRLEWVNDQTLSDHQPKIVTLGATWKQAITLNN